MQFTLSIIALSIFSAFLGVQAAPSSQVNRRSYHSTSSYSHEQPKAYTLKVEAYQPKQEVYTPKVESYQPKQEVYTPKVEAYQPKQEVYTPKVESYQPKQEVYTPKVEAYQPKKEVYTPKVEVYQPEQEVYKPEPVKPSYSPKPYVAEKPVYVKARNPVY
ncbi:hypothetical protein DSO57_1022542 [Entomophthora muscae]|uniref:Uncharacterized protein n=1 Tax=Entomophthora muscae TaxID=34485 RepID=A0ACC2TQF3_9FUNG|nr:hypothetical protein DSO57_1022542 [Entomophthora muscae]